MASYTQGQPFPLGTKIVQGGVNFAVFSSSPSISLYLFHPNAQDPCSVISLDPKIHKTDDIWHVFIPELSPPFEYLYEVLFQGKKTFVHDPYAKGLSSSYLWGESKEYFPRGRCFIAPPFNWEGIKKPSLPLKNWILYEMHVRGFTKDPSSGVSKKGTFLGAIEKIPHLISLGITAVELLPIFEFDENAHKKERNLVNFWGYSTVNFFCPMQRYAFGSKWEDPITECKTLIKELHKQGICVILDVVYNHTAEGGEEGPILSFKGLHQKAYYCLDAQGKYLNYSGTGNTLNCNHPVTRKMIVDSLVYWAEEMQVDGFRFDLASIFCRSSDGQLLKTFPLLEEIRKQPALKNTVLIAEAWDADGLYQVGSFPGGKNWSEWNGKYRDTVRKFIKGTDWQVAPFMQAICGSQDLYNKYSPLKSINFVTCHDGYTLHDLVSYQGKHNEANLENNKDGASDNESWNCGVEGLTQDKSILLLRNQQMKNFLTALFISLGVPMILMGDEYGHTKYGNNNTYCQDNALNWFQWDALQKREELVRFTSLLIAYRKERSALFCKNSFFTDKDIHWIDANWRGSGRLISYILSDTLGGKDCLIVFNAHYESSSFFVPFSKKWGRVLDTALSYPRDFTLDPQSRLTLPDVYLVAPRSVLVAEAILDTHPLYS